MGERNGIRTRVGGGTSRPSGGLWDQQAQPGVDALAPFAGLSREEVEEVSRKVDACPWHARDVALRVRPYQRNPKPKLPTVPDGHSCEACNRTLSRERLDLDGPDGGRMWGVLEAEGYSPEPVALFASEDDAHRWVKFMTEEAEEDLRHACDHFAVVVVDIDGGFAWNSYDQPSEPALEAARRTLGGLP